MSAADSNIRDNSLQSGPASSDVHSLSGPIQPVNETAESDSLLSASEMPEANSASIETSETYIQGKEPARSMAQGVQPELEGAQSFLNIVLNTLSDPVFAKDEQHRWISVNDACCKFLGRDREEILGKTDFDIFPSTEAMQFWQSDDRLLTTGSTMPKAQSTLFQLKNS